MPVAKVLLSLPPPLSNEEWLQRNKRLELEPLNLVLEDISNYANSRQADAAGAASILLNQFIQYDVRGHDQPCDHILKHLRLRDLDDGSFEWLYRKVIAKNPPLPLLSKFNKRLMVSHRRADPLQAPQLGLLVGLGHQYERLLRGHISIALFLKMLENTIIGGRTAEFLMDFSSLLATCAPRGQLETFRSRLAVAMSPRNNQTSRQREFVDSYVGEDILRNIKAICSHEMAGSVECGRRPGSEATTMIRVSGDKVPAAPATRYDDLLWLVQGESKLPLDDLEEWCELEELQDPESQKLLAIAICMCDKPGSIRVIKARWLHSNDQSKRLVAIEALSFGMGPEVYRLLVEAWEAADSPKERACVLQSLSHVVKWVPKSRLGSIRRAVRLARKDRSSRVRAAAAITLDSLSRRQVVDARRETSTSWQTVFEASS